MRNRLNLFEVNEAASTAVEFAFVAPVLLSLVTGIFAFGSIISIENGVQQIAAEAARSSVSGLSDSERSSLAQSYVAATASSYPFLDTSKLSVSTDAPTATTFRVQASYDMSSSVVYRAFGYLPLPAPVVTRAAVVQRGGF